MKEQKNKKAADFLGLKVLSTLDERLIVGGTMGVVEHHDHTEQFEHDHHPYHYHDDIDEQLRFHRHRFHDDIN